MRTSIAVSKSRLHARTSSCHPMLCQARAGRTADAPVLSVVCKASGTAMADLSLQPIELRGHDGAPRQSLHVGCTARRFSAQKTTGIRCELGRESERGGTFRACAQLFDHMHQHRLPPAAEL
eukprot:1374481-Rhodomonas_salina.1